MISPHIARDNDNCRTDQDKWPVPHRQGPESDLRRMRPGHAPLLDDLVLRGADDDGGGRLSPEEAAHFVKAADRTGEGSASAREIDRSLREHSGRPDGK